ncbi:MAG TPA: hypothetical protein VEZ55_09845 [Chitinophagaceae bacterium]|nr:hypothetical protein [Chitinophagaceae bacterium]
MTLEAPLLEPPQFTRYQTATGSLSTLLIKVSFVNLFLLAAVGVLLRTFPMLPQIPFTYLNLLHGHSHFAFGGWLMPVILALLLQSFPHLSGRIKTFHWRVVSVLVLFSAYGMLIVFPFQGYKPLSIVFSTLSVLSSFYVAVLLWKASGFMRSTTARKFLRAGVVYLVLSAIGPFATGPLVAMGKAGSPLYYDAIYFYLHFQYNGWFSFIAFSLFYNRVEHTGRANNGSIVFLLLNLSCVPAYFLSTLWHQPSLVLNFIGGMAALLQVVAAFYLFRDVSKCKLRHLLTRRIIHFSFSALAVKFLLQLLSAFPVVAAMAYENRNWTIAYLHLVLIGFISFFIVGCVVQQFELSLKNMRIGAALFSTGFIATELLLVAEPTARLLFGYAIPQYAKLLLIFSLFLLAGAGYFVKQLVHLKKF